MVLRKILIIVILLFGVTIANAQAYKSMRVFTNVLNHVKSNYIEEKKHEELAYYAIQGVLKSLDPHTVYLNPPAFARYRLMSQGKLTGFGFALDKFEGRFYVTGISQQGPAFDAGIRIGDILTKIDTSEILDTLSLTEANLMLYGEEGSEATMFFERPGSDKKYEFEIERTTFEVPTVILKEIVGSNLYIRLSQFGPRSDVEIEKVLEDVDEEDYSKIVLDLRENPGGQLLTCFKSSALFLSDGDTIYTSKGRKKSLEEAGVCEGDPITEKPMVALINRNSASAAELMSGTLQDNDRAVLIGTNTFGKGLIQSPFFLNNGGGIIMTIGGYQTPSGRKIQKEYKRTTRNNYYDIMQSVDSTNYRTGTKYKSVNGRTVYGGGGDLEGIGGIFPDIFIDNEKLTSQNVSEDSLYTFVSHFIIKYIEIHPDFKNEFNRWSAFKNKFIISEDDYSQVCTALLDKDKNVKTMQYSANLANYIKTNIARQFWDYKHAFLVRKEHDVQLNYALKMSVKDVESILKK